MTMEAGVLLSANGVPIYWHKPADRSAVSLPDSPDLWDVFWKNRKGLSGFAHSHPGGGTPHPSDTDLTTFAAIEAGLGLRLFWWIVSEDDVSFIIWTGRGKLDYHVRSLKPLAEPGWVPHLRTISQHKQAAPITDWWTKYSPLANHPQDPKDPVLAIECPECKSEPGVVCYPHVLVTSMVCLARARAALTNR